MGVPPMVFGTFAVLGQFNTSGVFLHHQMKIAPLVIMPTEYHRHAWVHAMGETPSTCLAVHGR
jgi:hypothetical protein